MRDVGTSPYHARVRAIALVLGLALAALATPGARAAGPSVVITSPSDGAVVGNGSPAIVTFTVFGFTLVQPGLVGQIVAPTEGHLNVYVDGGYMRLVTRVEPIPLPLTSGPHTIHLQLVESDGTPLIPDANATVHVVATQGPTGGIPSLAIVTPEVGQVTGHDVYVYVAVSNFAVVAPRGQPDAPNEGHVRIYRDGIFQQDLGVSNFGFLVDMPDGNHTITARLVSNNDSPLTPDASANVTITVRSAADPTRSEAFTGGVSVLLAAILVVLLLRRRRAVVRVRKGKTSGP